MILREADISALPETPSFTSSMIPFIIPSQGAQGKCLI